MEEDQDKSSRIPAKVDGRGAPLGNRNSIRHGLYSPRTGHALRARRVRRLLAHVYAMAPWLKQSDVIAVRAFCDLELKLGIASSILESSGLTNEKGEPRRLLGEYRGMLTLQLAYLRELGLTPTSAASLRVDSLEGDNLATDLLKARQKAAKEACNE